MILVIAYEEDQRRTLVKILEEAGHNFRFSSGPNDQVLRDLKTFQPAMVICDLETPDVDGLDLIRAIRMNDDFARVAITVLSSADNRRLYRQVMTLGADDLITKPYFPHELLAGVKARLNRFQPVLDKLQELKEYRKAQASINWTEELINPLTGILGGSELLLSEGNLLSRSEIQEIGEIVHNSSQKLMRTTRQVIAYCNLERKRIFLEPYIQHSALVKPVLMKQAERIAKSQNRISDLLLMVSDSEVQIPKEWLDTLLEELLENAFRYSERGTPVEVQGVCLGHSYEVTIQDRGPGLTEQEIQCIGPYRKFPRNGGIPNGLGLGLSLCRQISQAYDLDLDFLKSREGDKWIARIRFPLKNHEESRILEKSKNGIDS